MYAWYFELFIIKLQFPFLFIYKCIIVALQFQLAFPTLYTHLAELFCAASKEDICLCHRAVSALSNPNPYFPTRTLPITIAIQIPPSARASPTPARATPAASSSTSTSWSSSRTTHYGRCHRQRAVIIVVFMVLYFFNLEQTVVEPRFMFVFTLHFVSFRFVRSFVRSFVRWHSFCLVSFWDRFWYFGILVSIWCSNCF